MKKSTTGLVLLALGILAYASIRDDATTQDPGILAPDAPEQELIDSPTSFVFGDYEITPLADFHIQARVLGRKIYRSGRESELSPVDLALGWGRMSDESVVKSIRISQSNRWYHWRVREFPIPRQEIETHSANMHLVPANEDIATRIKQVRRGEIIELSGSLIQARATTDDWRWTSSLKRNDTGGGSCELIWVEDFRIKTL